MKGVERRGHKQKYVEVNGLESNGLEATAYNSQGWHGSPSGREGVRARTWAINGWTIGLTLVFIDKLK